MRDGGPERVGEAQARIVVSLIECPRCGAPHETVPFLELEREVQWPQSPKAASHWALCPKLAEPVLLLGAPVNLLSGEEQGPCLRLEL